MPATAHSMEPTCSLCKLGTPGRERLKNEIWIWQVMTFAAVSDCASIQPCVSPAERSLVTAVNTGHEGGERGVSDAHESSRVCQALQTIGPGKHSAQGAVMNPPSSPSPRAKADSKVLSLVQTRDPGSGLDAIGPG